MQREVRRMFMVISICSMNLHHNCIGQLGSMVARLAMVWYFTHFTAGSVALTLWLCGSTSWMLVSSEVMYCRTALEHSLSSTCRAGLCPFAFTSLYMSWKVRTISSYFLLFM